MVFMKKVAEAALLVIVYKRPLRPLGSFESCWSNYIRALSVVCKSRTLSPGTASPRFPI